MLYLKLQHKPENLPAAYKKSHADKAWGSLELSFDNGLNTITLFHLEYKLIHFVSWYLDMHLPYLYRPFWLGDFPIQQSISEHIAHPANYNKVNSNQYINGYLAPISLKRAFSYFEPIPRILIGRRSLEDENPHLGEISLAGFDHHRNHFKIKVEYPRPSWTYRFDLAQYHQDSRLEVIRFLDEWQELAPEAAKKQALSLLRQALDSPDA